jgi:Brp/Blh family beta-carotene 15,15'-monooxygenase
VSTSTQPLRAVGRSNAPIETYLFSAIAIVAIVVFAVGSIAPPLAAQTVVLAALVAVLGLPHGALDPLIARRIGLWRGPLSFAVFNLGYLGAVAVVVVLWILAPGPSLVVFLAVSAVHFGADWNVDRARWLRVVAGIALLSLPSLSHQSEVTSLYDTLAPGSGAAIAGAQFWIAPLALAGMLVGAVLASRRGRSWESVELVLAAGLALVAPPLVFFAIYFCALHSARHLREGFAAESRGRLTVGIALIYTIVPILAAAGFLFASSQSAALDAQLLQVVFIGLAGLTVPHMILVALDARNVNRQLGQTPDRREPARPS